MQVKLDSEQCQRELMEQRLTEAEKEKSTLDVQMKEMTETHQAEVTRKDNHIRCVSYWLLQALYMSC